MSNLRTPNYPAKAAERIALAYNVIDGLVLIAIRGYYEKSIGNPKKNDLNVYDDALLIVPMKDGVVDESKYRAIVFNTDPSKYIGRIASLALSSEWSAHKGKPTPYYFIQGIHAGTQRSYEAYRQYGDMMVIRANGKKDIGYFGINSHEGGITNTSSLGCQTTHPQIWDDPKFAQRTPTEYFTYLQYLDYLAFNNPSLPANKKDQQEHGGKASRMLRIVPYILLSKDEADAFEQQEAEPTPQAIYQDLKPSISVPYNAPIWNTAEPPLEAVITTPQQSESPKKKRTAKPSIATPPITPLPEEAPAESNLIRNIVGFLLAFFGGSQAISDTSGLPVGMIDMLIEFFTQNITMGMLKPLFVFALIAFGVKMLLPNMGNVGKRLMSAYKAFQSTK